MVGLYILLIILPFLGIHFVSFNNDYLSKQTTRAINGFFIIVVFMNHVNAYILQSGYLYDGIGDGFCLVLNRGIRQLLVVMFLFYSGYGVMMSIVMGGVDYVRKMPKKRILTTLLNFDVAVFFFLLVDLSIGTTVSWKQLMLSLIAWESIGNSNWYIFVILCCYIATYTLFILGKKDDVRRNVWVLFGMIVMGAFILSFLRPGNWYDTMWAYAGGGVIAVYKKEFEEICKRKYSIVLFIAVIIFLILYHCPTYRGIFPNLCALSFAVIIVLLSQKVVLRNQFLVWLGYNLFPVYIYQRIPMILLYQIKNGEFVREHVFLYIISCLFITMGIAYFYKYWQISFRSKSYSK